MISASLAVLGGLLVLLWSADRFVEGAACAARHLGMPPLLIGMLIVGCGTSAPEMLVSALAAMNGNPGIALGNAYGSNITNIALILGCTAVIAPVTVQSRVLRAELPLLTVVTGLAVWQGGDGEISRIDAAVLLAVFAGLMAWSIQKGRTTPNDALGEEMERELAHAMPFRQAIFWIATGLVLLVASSRLLVWGAVRIAQGLGIGDLIIGLTVVALGTSLPELASSVMAARKNEHDIALGNVIGSNLFNTLAVVAIAAAIHPIAVDAEVLSRDLPVMAALTLSLFVFGYGFRGPGRINRLEGTLLGLSYLAYTAFLVASAF